MTESAGGGFWEKLRFPTKLLEEIVYLAPLKMLVSGCDARANHSPLGTSLRRWQPQRHTEKRRREPRPMTTLGFRLNQHDVSSTLGLLLQEIRRPHLQVWDGLLFLAVCISCQLLQSKLPHTFEASNSEHFLPLSFWGSGIWTQLSGVPPLKVTQAVIKVPCEAVVSTRGPTKSGSASRPLQWPLAGHSSHGQWTEGLSPLPWGSLQAAAPNMAAGFPQHEWLCPG